MTSPHPNIAVNVDVTNPGQFFACCGLLELADRLWPGAEGWFEGNEFWIKTEGTLQRLIGALDQAPLSQIDSTNNTSSPIAVGEPFHLRLDWWLDDRSGGKDSKVWAGTMESGRIAKAMQGTLKDERFQQPNLLDAGAIAYDPDNQSKKVEPYYFDARRTPNAHSRDVGFSPNDLQMTTTAFPAVELLCLIGLQRALPARTLRPRIFDYFTWRQRLPANLLSASVPGVLQLPGQVGYRFENWYRTGQKKHKAFRSATPILGGT